MAFDKSKLKIDYENHVWARGEKPPIEDLEYLYMDLKWTQEQIAKLMGKGKSSVARWVIAYNLDKPAVEIDAPPIPQEYLDELDWSKLSRNFIEKPLKRSEIPTKKDCEYLYIQLNWALSDIAQLIGKSVSRVQTIMRDYDIKKDMSLHQASREKMSMRKYGTAHTIAMKETREKIEQTCMDKYGMKSVLCDQNIKDEGMMKKYGVKHALESEQFMNKVKLKSFKRYGTEYTFQAEEVKEKIKQTMMERYGVSNPSYDPETLEKIRQSIQEHYGEEYTSAAQVPEVREKMKSTTMERYGVEHASQLEEIKQKVRETNLERHGVEYVFQKEEVQEKARQAMIDKYGVEIPNYIHIKHMEHFNREFWENHFIDKRGGGFDVCKCARYHNVTPGCVRNYMGKFEMTIRRKGGSIKEIELQQFIDSLNIPSERHNRSILEGKELDLYIPSKNFAIEYDGLMYHSQGQYNQGAIQDYPVNAHLQKTKDCEKQGIQLFHIFDVEWLNPHTRTIWQSMISAKLGISEKIYARNTEIVQVQPMEAEMFCKENHMQGGVKTPINIGLSYNNELVALMTFSTPRFNKNYNWELVRFCTKLNTTVIGGASKLLKHFRENYTGSIISYANRRWSNGSLYEKLGFTKIDETRPAYFYFKTSDGRRPVDGVLYNRVKFQKAKLPTLLPSFDERLTERENMFVNNYRTIYDCGNLVYVLEGN